MRALTLDEKITIKGLLARKPGFSGPLLAKAGMREMLHYWRMCYGKSIALYYKIPTRASWTNRIHNTIPGQSIQTTR